MLSLGPHFVPRSMTAEQKELVDLENKWRNMHAEDPTNATLYDLHLGLTPVFQSDFKYTPETDQEREVPKILTLYRRTDLEGEAIVSREQFLQNFGEFTQGCLEGINWNNVFVAGGSILGCLSTEKDGYRGSDIDLFIYGIEDELAANQKLRELYRVILGNIGGKGEVIRTNRALTILSPYPFRHVQIILRLFKTPAEVLLGFDIDSCCVGFDGKEVWAMERFRRAVTKRYNIALASRRSINYEQRLFKYSKRGFAVAVPNLDMDKVNTDIYHKQPNEVHGLSKLILYDFIQKTGRSNFTRKRKGQVTEEEGSDYNNDLAIPWGPEWQTDTIISMLNTKNKAKFFASVRKNQKDTTATEEPNPDTYNHLFTSNSEKLESGNFTIWKRSLDGVEIQRPIEWVKDYKLYQHQDPNQRHPLMIGAFQIPTGNWEEGLYLAPGQVPSLPIPPISHLPTPFPTSLPSLTLIPSNQSTLGKHIKTKRTKQTTILPPGLQGTNDINPLPFGIKVASAPFSFTPIQQEPTQEEDTISSTSDDSTSRSRSRSRSKSRTKPKVKPSQQFPLHPTSLPFPTEKAQSTPFPLQPANFPTPNINPLYNGPPLHPWVPQNIPQMPPPLPVQSPTTKLLLLLSLISKQGKITEEVKNRIKDLVLSANALVISALEVYEIDQDINEFVDTLKAIAKLSH